MLNAFKNSLSQSPMNSAYISKRTATSSSLRFDNGYMINPFEPQIQAFAAPFATRLSADGLSGALFGFFAGARLFESEYIAQASLAYARGESKQQLSTQETQINADLLQISGFTRLFYDKFEVDLGADLTFGKFSIENSWFDDSEMNFNAKFGNYQANLNAILGYRFGENFSIKPFAGARALFEKQDSFRQNGGLNLQSKAYNEFIFGALFGFETRYILENGAFIFAKASYETLNAGKNENFRLQNEILSYENYKNTTNLSIGGRIFTKDFGDNSLKIDIEALYQHYDDGLNAFGGNVFVRWQF